jgi:two-component system, response regulator YesN
LLKVLLVDDEMFVRKGLSSLIHWESLGYMICGEAENGEEAIAAIGLYEPDLVITDIRMPVLDGLELIQFVKQSSLSDAVFIVVSGYHDFSYAQKALRYGVCDYILKPIDENELAETLRNISGRLSMNKLRREHFVTDESDSILASLLHREVRPEDCSSFEAVLQMTGSTRFTYLLIEVHPGPNAELSNGRIAIAELLKELLVLMGTPPICEHRRGVYGILFDDKRLEKAQRTLESMVRSMGRRLTQLLQTQITICIGHTVNRIIDVRQSFRSAMEAAQYKFAYPDEAYIYYDSIQDLPLSYLDISPELYAQLMEGLGENDPDALSRTTEQMFRQFKEQRLAPSSVANSITRSILGAAQIIKDMGGTETGSMETFEELMNWQDNNWNPNGLKKLFLRFMTEAAETVAVLRKEQAKGGIERIKKYIEAHYAENISLKSISAIFYMNPVYLGQLFRKTYGVYFNDFLLGLRVHEAKRLLRQSDMRMYEIAEKVGFQNADYFVTQFEKLEHMSPTVYRNKLLNKS